MTTFLATTPFHQQMTTISTNYDNNNNNEETVASHSVNTNPRYKYFRQEHFTAGDEEQFISAWDASAGRDRMEPPASVPITTTTTSTTTPPLEARDVYESFSYLFHEMKKGIFVKFRDNAIRNFLPFSKADYTNSWSERFFTWDTKRFPDVNDMFRFVSEFSGHTYRSTKVHKNRAEWYANNGIFRYEHPISEGESGVNMVYHMMSTLATERTVPDVDFFLNKRDFPLLSRDTRRHPYEALYGEATDVARLTSYGPGRIPVLSMTTSDNHRDIPIPTWEDWCRASYQHNGVVFPKPCREYPDPMSSANLTAVTPWEAKYPRAIFRGASTGLSPHEERNPRLRYAIQSQSREASEYFDVGITKWNLRPRREHAKEPFTVFRKEVVDQIPIVETMDLVEQSRYKYILHLPGHSCAYRLSYELSSGSVILLYPCKYRLWYSHLLMPMIHYVPLEEEEDLVARIQWCRANDGLMKTIAKNARDFYDKYLSRDGILDHLQGVMWQLYAEQGFVAVHYPLPGKSLEDRHWEIISKENSIKNSMTRSTTTTDWLSRFPSSGEHAAIQAWWEETRNMSSLWWEEHILNKSEFVKRNKNTEIRSWSPDATDQRFTFCLKIRYHNIQEEPDRELAHESFVYSKMMNCEEEDKTGIGRYFPKFYVLWSGEMEEDENDHHYNNIQESESGGISILVTQFIRGRTMEQWLQSPWSDDESMIRAVLNVFAKISLVLDIAQDRLGFMHLDLYPWNIMIIPKVPDVTSHGIPEEEWACWSSAPSGGKKVVYTSVRELCPMWDICFIDVGRSNVLHEKGYAIHNVVPFTMNRMHDLMTIVWNTVFIIFKHHRVAPEVIRTIHNVLRYFDPVFPLHLRNGRWRIYDMMQYLQHHKKFSAMLHASHNFPMPSVYTPFTFFKMLLGLFPTMTFDVRPILFENPPFTLPPPLSSSFRVQQPVSRRHVSDTDAIRTRLQESMYTINTWYQQIRDNPQTQRRARGSCLVVPYKPSDLFFL